MKKTSIILALSMSMCLLTACGSITISSESPSSESSSSKSSSGESSSGKSSSGESSSGKSSSGESSSDKSSSGESSSSESKPSESSQNSAGSTRTDTIYTVFSGNRVNEHTIEYTGEKKNAKELADELTKLTGLDFTITASKTNDGLIVDWDADSSLFTGPKGEQKEGFFFFDYDSSCWFMMDTLWTTLTENLDAENIYYTMDGGQELVLQRMSPSMTIPSDTPYMGSNFYSAHADVKGDDEESSYENTQAAENYLGTWNCDRATLNISDNGDGTYQGKITWANSAFEDVEWVYILIFDAESQSMVCNNNAVKTYYEYKDGIFEPETTVMYTGGSGSFYLANGVITWYDAEENRGEGMEFVK